MHHTCVHFSIAEIDSLSNGVFGPHEFVRLTNVVYIVRVQFAYFLYFMSYSLFDYTILVSRLVEVLSFLINYPYNIYN